MEARERLDTLEARLARLEAVVFQGRRPVAGGLGALFTQEAKPTGPSSGIRLLIAEGFFESKRNLGEVRGALEERGYRYSAQAVDIALRRMAHRDGPLVVLRERGRHCYANRK
jgi:hypothetical protein